MTELKTKPTAASVSAFIDRIPDEGRRRDCRTLLRLMKRASRIEPRMWGASIVGFGSYHYKYASGHEGDCCLIGFASRKSDLTLYITTGFEPYGTLMRRLGKHRTGKGCLYIKRLSDVDLSVLEELIGTTVKDMKRRVT